MHTQDIQGSHVGAAAMTTAADTSPGNGGARADGAPRTTPLRVDAQRNLEHVLRAAREVFGELGYGAPMEDVARRARVGVGTVYRRFPSKDVLVRRIAEEETARLTEQARSALGYEDEPWAALSRFLRTSVASGAGRLLPPRILRAGDAEGGQPTESGPDEHPTRVPQQRVQGPGQAHGEAQDDPPHIQPNGRSHDRIQAQTYGRIPETGQIPEGRGPSHSPVEQTNGPVAPGQLEHPAGRRQPNENGLRLVEGGASASDAEQEPDSADELLSVVGQLVERAREAGELRTDVTVGDVLLVIATAAPSLPDAGHRAAASRRLLDILLEGLRSRPAQ